MSVLVEEVKGRRSLRNEFGGDIRDAPIKACRIWSANVLEVDVGTNTPCGGDAGHGGRTLFSLSDIAGTCWEVNITDEDGYEHHFYWPQRVEIRFAGDTEAETFLEALRFAVKVLEEQIARNREVMQRGVRGVEKD